MQRDFRGRLVLGIVEMTRGVEGGSSKVTTLGLEPSGESCPAQVPIRGVVVNFSVYAPAGGHLDLSVHSFAIDT